MACRLMARCRLRETVPMPDPIDTIYVPVPEWERVKRAAVAAERDARRREWEIGILRYLCILLAWVAGMVLLVWQLSPLIEAWAG